MTHTRFKLIALTALTAGMMAACGPAPNSMPSMSYPYPSASGTPSPQGLAALLTGQVVSSEEAQLRDIKSRQILLDFPVKVGFVYYNLDTRLEAADLKAQFDEVKSEFKNSGQVRETIQIPNTLVSGSVTIEELRKLGARFQCDIIVLLTGSHSFERAKSQNLSFFDSFSEKANYESKVKLDAIALDVFTGTLLSPFDAAVSGQPVLLDRAAADFADKSYKYQQETEAKAWLSLRTEALERLNQLKLDVDKRKAELANQPMPSPTPSPTVSPSPEPNPAA